MTPNSLATNEHNALARLNDRICLGVASYTPLLRSGSLDLEGFLTTAQRLHFRLVEVCDKSIASTEPEYLETIRRRAETLGLRIACVDIRNDFTSKDGLRLRDSIDHTRVWLRVAQMLGARVVRVWGGRASADDAAVARVVTSFRELVPEAKAAGVRMGLENHGGVTENPDQVLRIIDRVGSPWLGTCPDFGWLAQDDRVTGLRKLFPVAVHAHAKTHSFTPAGADPEIDYAKIGDIARENNYCGLLAVEYEGNDCPADEGVEKTLALLRKHFMPPCSSTVSDSHVPITISNHGGTATPGARNVTPRSYADRLVTRNIWDDVRQMVVPWLEELVKKPETAGVVVLGGLADSPARHFLDECSDVDIALFLSIPDASGYSCPKRFAREHPESLPEWLPSFQFFVPFESDRMEINCHQLIMEIEECPDRGWSPGKREAYSRTGEIYFDRSGAVARLIATKCAAPASFDDIVVKVSQLPWYGWRNPRRLVRRGLLLTAKMVLNIACDQLLELVFWANDTYPPHLKWRHVDSHGLSWRPSSLDCRLAAILEAPMTEDGILNAADTMEALATELEGFLHKEKGLPLDPFTYVSVHIDPDRQLPIVTPADQVLRATATEAHAAWRSHGELNWSLNGAGVSPKRRG